MGQAGRRIRGPYSRGLSCLGGSSQYFGDINSDLCGEQRLMLAVLVDAVNILNDHPRSGGSKQLVFAEAVRWITVKETRHPFSFDSVCDALNISAKMLREHLGKLGREWGEAYRMGIGRLRLQPTNRARHYTMASGSRALYKTRIGTARAARRRRIDTNG
jgi:hypothetical protein